MEGNIAYLTLSTGHVLTGKWLHQTQPSEGEMVFNTAMTGYEEVMTDPSYAGQIVTMTYPLIGNCGFTDLPADSKKPSLAGFIVSYPYLMPENNGSVQSITEIVKKYDIPTVYDIDTRALTRIIREHGEVYGKITANKDDFPTMSKLDEKIVEKVSTRKTFTFSTSKNNGSRHAAHTVIIDFGYRHSIAKTLTDFGCDVTIVPFNITLKELEMLRPDAVILSNGPGNPKDLLPIAPQLKEIIDRYPTFGICLGHQLIALANGGNTKRLPYGHRGTNHPVKDMITGKVFITSQNHGYVVEHGSLNETEWQITHINVNDQSIEGVKHCTKPIMGVQFHPEAQPGPEDSLYVFQQFLQLVQQKGEKVHA